MKKKDNKFSLLKQPGCGETNFHVTLSAQQKPDKQEQVISSTEEACDHKAPQKKKNKREKCRVEGTHRDDPPVAQLTGGVGQDEHGEAEDSQQLHRTAGKTEEERV